MTCAYYAGPDAVKGLQKFHDKGDKVSKNSLKKLEGVHVARTTVAGGGSLKILNVQRVLGTEITKSCVVPAAAGVTGDFKTVGHRVHCWQVELSKLRRPELQLWCTNP